MSFVDMPVRSWREAAQKLGSFGSQGSIGFNSFRPPEGVGMSQGQSAAMGGVADPGMRYRSGFFDPVALPTGEGETWAEANIRETAEELGQSPPGQDTSSANVAPGAPASKGGSGWEIQNQWDDAYSSAAEVTGVPANVIKALQAKETGKFWQGTDAYGMLCDDPVLNPGMGCIALNTGIYQATAESWGLDFGRIVSDPEYAIHAIGVVLAGIGNSDAGRYGGTPGQTVVEDGGWEAAAAIYFGGSMAADFVDGNGETTGNYLKDFTIYLEELGGYGSTPAGEAAGAVNAVSPVGSVSSISDMWGGQQAPITQEMGSMEGAVYNNNPTIYDYCTEMGVQGHCGVDVGLPVGTPIAAPISGTVVHVGNEYFSNPNGVGEIRVQADNGDIIIFGHMQNAAVAPGDRIDVGNMIGTTGQSDPRPDSAHLHLEVRVLQADGTYRIADPRTYFGGAAPGATPISGATTTTPAAGRSELTGGWENSSGATVDPQVLTGGGSWRDYLDGMQSGW